MTPQELAYYEKQLFRHIFWYNVRRRMKYAVRVLFYTLAILLSMAGLWSVASVWLP
jgi:hypothetical protein